MQIDSLISLLILALPLLLTATYLVLLPAPLAPRARLAAGSTLLGILLLTLTACLLLIRINAHSGSLNASRWVSASLAMFAAGLVASPLLDRARNVGLMLAASLIGIFMIPLLLHVFIMKLPPIGGVAVLYSAIIASVLVGLGGSFQLPLHPQRFTAEGMRRAMPTNSLRLCLGWLLLSGVTLLFNGVMCMESLDLLPILLSGLIGALLPLLRSKAHDGPRKAGEGFAAGILITGMGTFSPETAAALGLLGGYCVLRSEAITSAIRLDDPQNFTGTLLLPAILGLLFPAMQTLSQLGQHIVWLGAATALGITGALLIWPLTKLTFGLALPPEQLK